MAGRLLIGMLRKIKLKHWTTIIQAIDPIDGQLKSYQGPNVSAPTWKLANDYCQTHGLGYCKVDGQLTSEIPCKPGNFEPDYSRAVFYDQDEQIEKN